MRTLRAHRFAFRYFVGQLVDGMVIDHLCRNRQCVNPHHMEAVTVRENTLRGEAAPAHNIAKNHCDAGHPFDRINTYLDPRGHRGCRACRAEAAARYQAKRRQAAS
ncbi:HNH endonuclease signature motif containing protein [Embleya sp. NPDC001921]